jgi:hypothetical protein
VSFRVILAVFAFSALLCACGGGDAKNVLEPATPTATVQPTLKPFVPDEEPAPGPPTGRVTTQLVANCSLSTIGSVITANYRANVVGPNSTLRRVRLMINNKLADDSGDIFATSFERDVKLNVASGSNYSLIITYIATNAAGPQILNIVRCPAAPGTGA